MVLMVEWSRCRTIRTIGTIRTIRTIRTIGTGYAFLWSDAVSIFSIGFSE